MQACLGNYVGVLWCPHLLTCVHQRPPARRLVLVGPYLLSPLPYGIEPGALPMLHSLQLGFSQLHSTLPPGWGADSRVLPRLHELRIRMQVGGRGAGSCSGMQEMVFSV